MMGAETSGRILGLILAGGASRRFGSDKMAAMLGGKSVAEQIVARATPQVDLLAWNALCDRLGLGLDVIVDETPGQGPLAGVLAGLHWAKARGFEFVATVPGDSPFFPPDIIARLRSAWTTEADCVMARHHGVVQFAFALFAVNRLEKLKALFAAGERSLKSLQTGLRCSYGDFSDCDDGPGGDPFFNINRPDDLKRAEAWLQDREQ